ncbi:hypothetical protein EJ110_NYTH38845 [Nymphaea thermarum]|nr:hypothetical protein EJ110_NYTH38845 [Nymphaea thermarum]
MPCLRLPKSLLPPRRELKRLSSAVKNGLDWLARAKPGRSAVTAFRSVLRQARSLPLAGGWRREVEFGSRSHTVEGRRCMYEPPRSTRRFEPVYVDELVGGGSSYSGGGGQAEKGRGPGEVGRKEGPKPGRQKGPVMAWEVNERAEEFIERFREGMRVEREESIEDFKEMLARGAR